MVPLHKYFTPRCTACAYLVQTISECCGSSALLHCRVCGVCVEHSQMQWHPDLRRRAYDCLMRMTAAVAGLDATVNLALDAVELETAPLVRYSSSTHRSTILLAEKHVCFTHYTSTKQHLETIKV